MSWNYNDPVTELYSSVFDHSRFFDHKLSEEALEADKDNRFLHQLPPGYKDKSKDDGGIGDVAIWQTILEIGRTVRKPLIFVSNDEKSDWVVRSGDYSVAPRYELTDEYYRQSGNDFYIIPFSRFLDLNGARKPTVAQAREFARAEALAESPFFEHDVYDIALLEVLKRVLDDLEDALMQYLSSYDIGEDEYVYIRDSEILNAVEFAQAALSREMNSAKYRPIFVGHIKRIAANLDEIMSLNTTLAHMESRMKSNGDKESHDQFKLCKRTHNIVRIFRGIVERSIRLGRTQ